MCACACMGYDLIASYACNDDTTSATTVRALLDPERGEGNRPRRGQACGVLQSGTFVIFRSAFDFVSIGVNVVAAGCSSMSPLPHVALFCAS